MIIRLVPLAAVVVAAAFASTQSAPLLRGTVELTIGNGDDDPDYSFGRVTGITVARDGRILVADGQDQNIRVFSEVGKFLFKFGRKGSGPGEFTGVAALAFAPDGALWARDEGNSRYQAFTLGPGSAQFRSTVRMLHPQRESRLPFAFDATGNIIEIGGVSTMDASPYRIVMTTLGADSRVIRADTVREPPADSIGMKLVAYRTGGMLSQRYFYAPFAALPITAYGVNGDVARGVSSRYALRWTCLDRCEPRLIQREVAGPEPTAAERKEAQESFDEDVATAKTLGATLPSFRIPARKPPVAAAQFSLDGDLWVERTAAAGKPREADVYDKGGRLVAIVQWSGFSALNYWSAISGRTVVTVTRDTNDVERVVRMRFR